MIKRKSLKGLTSYQLLYAIPGYTIGIVFYHKTKNIYIQQSFGIKAKRVTKKQYEINKKILHQLKINGCAKCGYNKCYDALEFHHVNPEDKKFNINQTWVNNKNIVEELNKCILLCCRCHREIERKEKDYDKTSY